MNKKIYISGAIDSKEAMQQSGLSREAWMELQRKRFGDAATMLWNMGWRAINPFANGVPATASWRVHMKVDIGLLLQCDAIYLLDGWGQSKGCKLELDIATTCGMEVYFEKPHTISE